jgi:hypothetical protein
MTRPTSTEAPASHPPLTARQAIERFLGLTRTTKTLQDVTPQSMHQAMGVAIQSVSSDHYGYGQALPGHWAFSIERHEVGPARPQVNLSFGPIPGKQASPRDICEPDVAHVAQALQGMGFTRNSSYGEHQRWLYDDFERPGLRVEVYPLTGRSDRGESMRPTCVGNIRVG